MRSCMRRRSASSCSGGGSSSRTTLPSASRRAATSCHDKVRTKPCAGMSLPWPWRLKYGQHTGVPPRIGVGSGARSGDSQNTSCCPFGANDSSWPPNSDTAALARGVSTSRASRPWNWPRLNPGTGCICMTLALTGVGDCNRTGADGRTKAVAAAGAAAPGMAADGGACACSKSRMRSPARPSTVNPRCCCSAAIALRVALPIMPSAAPMSWPRASSRVCSWRRCARDRPGSSVGQAAAMPLPPT